MRATSIGHAGILIETRGRTIVCDPWFTPAFFGSWFVFPRNDRLDAELMDKICNPDFLYVSHLHGDHFDADFLARRMNKSAVVVLPAFPTREMERAFNKLGFRDFVRTADGIETDLGDGITVAVHVETSITDGPGGDSAIVVSDGRHRLVDQNDCRTNDTSALGAHGPVDLHWLQFSGAIWYPMVYEMDPAEKKRLCDDKVESQFARALRYVEALGARAVVPSAGPPCFLDDELASFNMITGEEASIFPDQTEFLRRLADAGRGNGVLNVPGTTVVLEDDSLSVEHPMPDGEVRAIFENKAAHLAEYRRDWSGWLEAHKAGWPTAETDLVAELQAWWEPLLAMAPSVREGVGAECLLMAGSTGILIDFPEGKVRAHDGRPCAFRFDVDRRLIESVVAERSVDWSNSLFLSCRFGAWRAGDYNEHLYNFFKSLSVERMVRTEAEAARKLHGTTGAGGGAPGAEEDIVIGDYLVQRRCPHRNADLSVFGEIDGKSLVCTLHGWRFDLATGRCLTANEKQLRVRRR